MMPCGPRRFIDHFRYYLFRRLKASHQIAHKPQYHGDLSHPHHLSMYGWSTVGKRGCDTR